MRIFWFTLFGMSALAGCQMTSGRIIPSPLTYSEQEQRILAIAPQGTPREAAIQRLTEAGIEGSFGTNQSIYYCDLWKRENGDRWHMNVALLFDSSGNLYKAQVAQADTGRLSSNGPPPAALGMSSGDHPAGSPLSTPSGSQATPNAATSSSAAGSSDAWRATTTGNLKVGRELRDSNRR